ncbi:replicative DNA helicase [Endozoicomonas euniceicola]|nr:replicative DNA helicase [Endozoicomonas euniceicola]
MAMQSTLQEAELPIDQATVNLKTPPHSIEAEQSVLGGLMLDNEAWDKVGDKITGDDFYHPRHRIIYTAMAKSANESLPFDPLMLADTLDRQGELDDAGGMLYITELVSSVAGVANIEAYANIIQERSVLRKLINISQKITERAYNPEGLNSQDVLDEAERLVFNIAEERPKTGGPQGVREILDNTVKKIDELFNAGDAITGITTGFTDLDNMTSGMQPSDMVIVAARPSMGKCIVSGSRVLDPESGELVKIDDIVIRQSGSLLSLGDDFRLSPATPSAFVDDGLKPVFKVKTALGRTIETTLTHPFLSGAGWQPLGNLKVGDAVAVPRVLPVFGHKRLPDHKIRLMAYFIGDGGTTQASLLFTNSNERVLEDFIAAVNDFGGVKGVRIEGSEGTPSVRVSSDLEQVFEARRRGRAEELFPGGYEQAVWSDQNPLTKWLDALGLNNRLAHEKTIPDIVYQLEKDSLAIFLSHLFTCDGSAFVQANSQCRISYSSSSYELIKGLQHLLLRFGVNAKVRDKVTSYEGAQVPYELEVLSQSSIQAFIDNIDIFAKEDRIEAVRKALAGKKPHDNSDTLPESVCEYILKLKSDRSWREIYTSAGKAYPENYNPHLTGKSRRGISRRRASLFAELFADDYLRRLANSDVYWDKIVAIEPQGDKQVYDLTVPDTHNFVAEDFCVHNTTFAMNLVENALLNTDKGIMVFSLEMPSEQLMMRMLSSLGRINQSKVRSGNLEEEDWPKLVSAVERIKDKKLFIDDTAGISPSEMRSRARRIVREHGELGMIMIDYLQLMQIPGYDQGRTNEISEISRSLKAIAKEFNVPVIALSQLNRSLEQRPNKRPVNSDLRESGAIEQDADVIMFIYRDEVYNPDTEYKGVGEIIIGKQRNGPIGSVRLAFIGQYTRFENLAPDAYNFDDDE